GHDEAADDGISWPYTLDVGRYLRNYPRDLMAQDARQRKFNLALDDVQVGMTDATGGHLHHNLTPLGHRCGEVLQSKLSAPLCKDSGFHEQDSSLSSSRRFPHPNLPRRWGKESKVAISPPSQPPRGEGTQAITPLTRLPR